MDKTTLKKEMKDNNNNLITVLENQVIADMSCSRRKANMVVNHMLDILDAYNEIQNEKEEDEDYFTFGVWENARCVKTNY